MLRAQLDLDQSGFAAIENWFHSKGKMAEGGPILLLQRCLISFFLNHELTMATDFVLKVFLPNAETATSIKVFNDSFDVSSHS